MNSSRSRIDHNMNKDDYSKRFDSRRRRRSRSRRRRKGSTSSSGSSRSRSGGHSRRHRRRNYSSRSKSSSPQLIQPRIETINIDDDSPQKPPWARMNFSHLPPPGFQGIPPGYPPQTQAMGPQPFPPQASGAYPPSAMNQGQYMSQPPVHEVGYSGFPNNSNFQPTFAEPTYQTYDAPPTAPPPPQTTSTAPWQTQSQQVFNQPHHANYAATHWHAPNNREQENTSNLIYPQDKNSRVEQEVIQQKKTLLKQREEYLKKNESLLREISRLKEQRQELLMSTSEDSERFLKENTKLQNEIGQRLKAIENVVEMLTGLIGDSFELPKIDKMPSSSPPIIEKMKKIPESKVEKPVEELRMPIPERRVDPLEDDVKLDSPPRNQANATSSYYSPNLVHYDPELHWCSLCNVFPKTVVAYLNHLHTPEHRSQIVRLKLDESPWHSDITQESVPPFNKDAPSKRVPIRGVQFLVPSTGWYCRLCKVWLGDLHCCSNHLKAAKHTSNYSEYVSQNPHWEVDWLADRTRSYERSSEQLSRMTDATQPSVAKPPQPNQHQRTAESEQAQINVLSNTLLAVLAQQNKGKTRVKDSSSSSSSSSSDESSKRKDKKKKKKKKKRRKESHSKSATPVRQPKSPEDDALISEWMAPKDEIMPKFRDVIPDKSDSVVLRHKFVTNEKPKEYKEYREMRMEVEESREKVHPKNSRNSNPRNMPEPQRDFRDDRGRRSVKDSGRSSSREHEKYDRESSREHKRREDFGSRVYEKRKPDLSKYVSEPKKEPPKPPEKPKGNLWYPTNKDEEEIETSFEKQSAESAAKKKAEARKPTQFTLPKTKLPFIGRMPILKKKPPELKTDDKAEEPSKHQKEETLSAKGNIWPNIPISEEEDTSNIVHTVAEKPSLPKSTLIISKRPGLGESEDTSIKPAQTEGKKKTEDNLAEQDMDIECDEQEPIIWEGTETATTVPEAKEELHKDFKDALDLLFPEEGKEGTKKASDKKDDEAEGFTMGPVGPMWLPTGVPPPVSNAATYYPANYGGQTAGYYAQGYDANYQGGYYAQGAYGPFNTGVPPPVVGVPPPGVGVPPPGVGVPPPGVGVPPPGVGVPPPGVGVPPPGVPPPVGVPPANGATPINIPPPVPPPGVHPLGIVPATDANGAPLMAPPPPGMDEDDEDETAPKKRKNPLSQRMRRHLRKKKAEAESESESKSETPAPPDEIKKKYEGMEMSDLAMLGIDEDDCTAQQF